MASKISHIPAVVSSPALIAALLSFSIAQIAKVFTHYHATGKVDYSRIVGSGGMPSSHTALVVGLVLPFDRLLDMTRTVPSASANLTVATLVARGEGALDDARLRGRVAA